ncbi:cytochrome P450 [Nocardioides sp. 503]|uniref:cytochrome P450 n=1 Tax=Nocardioides sp. 503 TaxID=2508326 RepID=UPI00106F5345|nr:cytochrome P450 [Nocardioides sp. 503]
MVTDGGLARVVLTDRRFGVREDFLQRRLPAAVAEGVIASRRHLNPGLRPSAVAPLRTVVSALTRRELLGGLAPGRSLPFDPLPALERVTSRAMARHTFGPGADAVAGSASDLLEALSAMIGNPFALPANRVTPARRRILRHYEHTMGLVRALLRSRMEDPDAFPDHAAQVARGFDAARLEECAHMLVGALLAADRVPGAAAAWMLLCLSDHAPQAERLEPEAALFAQHLEDGQAPPLSSYPRAVAFVREVLRLHPPTWLITRTATGPVGLGGYEFSAGHTFMLSPYALQRDERVLDDASRFRPERWATSAPPGFFLPFGQGLHRCPGQHFALSLLVSILLTVVHEVRVSRAPGTVTADPRTTLLPVGLAVTLQPRSARSGRGVAAAAGGGGGEPLPRCLA